MLRGIFVAVLCAFIAIQHLDSKDEAALHDVVKHYFSAYASGDIEGWYALWSVNSPERPARRRAMEALAAAGRYTFTPPRISRVNINGETATLWATATRTLVPGERALQTKIALALTLVREGGIWKIHRESPATSELAVLLIDSASAQEREDLLLLDSELLTRDLLAVTVNRADRFYRDREYTRSLDLYHLVIRIAAIKDWGPDAAGAWRSIGNIHFTERKPDEALAAYGKSLEIENTLDRPLDRINVLTNIGLVEAVRGNTDAAIAAFNKSLAISLEIDDPGGAASALEHIGRIERDSGRYAQAAASYRRAIPLREAIRDRAATARAMIAVAEVEYDRGESDAAIAAYVRAIPLTGGKQLVHTLHNLANLYYLQGNFAPALRTYESERDAAIKIRDAQGEAAAQVGIGLVHSLYGDHARSLEAYRRNLALNLQLRENGEGESMDLPVAHQRVGGAWYALGEYDRALEHYEEQLKLREAMGDAAEIAWALLDVGQSLAGRGEYTVALERDERSLKIFEELKDQTGVCTALLHISGVHLKAEAYAQARDAADRAAGAAGASGDTEVYWQARFRAGKALFRMKQHAAARRQLLDAVATIEGPPGRVRNNRPQRALEPRIAPYQLLVDLAVEKNQTAEALTMAERGRERQMKWLLESGSIRITKSMTAAERAREQEFHRRIASLYTQLSRARERQLPASRLDELQRELQQARAALRDLEAQLYRARPQLKLYRGDGPAVTAAQAAQLLPAPDAVILEYVETEEQIYLFTLARGTARNAPPRLQAYALGVGREDLAEQIASLQHMVTTRGEGWEPVARYLYDVLLKPAEGLLESASQLLIVADGVLWNIPFAALLDENGRFVIESRSLAVSPSMGTLRVARLARINTTRSTPSVIPLLAFGGPELSPATIERMKLGRRSDEMDLMPDTEREANEIGRIVTGARVYVARDAHSDRLRAEAVSTHVVHMAVPATIDEASPFYSSAAFASAPDDVQKSAAVELREWFDRDMRAGLVVWSGAEIAPRGCGTGKGLAGLGWAFAVTGVRSVLAGQWRPATTTDLMIEFYRGLNGSQTPARAWRRAVAALLESGEYRHPYYWAGFVVIGE